MSFIWRIKNDGFFSMSLTEPILFIKGISKNSTLPFLEAKG